MIVRGVARSLPTTATEEAEMSTIVVGTFLTVDGVMQAPGAPEEDREGGFEHGGWLAPHFDDELGRLMVEWTNQADAVLLGRTTYEIFAGYWPNVSDDDPIAAKLNRVQKYVASRTLESVEWANSTLLRGDAAEEVAKLRAADLGEIQVTGSGDLVQTLMRHDLVDEYRLLVFPVVLGTGKRLFAEGTVPAGLELAETRASATGVVVSTYRRTGRPAYGDMTA
jgi:dihydrofolate reductase